LKRPSRSRAQRPKKLKGGYGVRGRLRRAGVPVVETWDLTARPIDMAVGFGNEEAGRA